MKALFILLAAFGTYYPLLLKNEGKGYVYLSRPNGTIECSKYGATFEAFGEYSQNKFDADGDGIYSRKDVKFFTPELLQNFYKTKYWDKPYRLDAVESQIKATDLAEMAINMGDGYGKAHIKAVQLIIKDKPTGQINADNVRQINAAQTGEFCVAVRAYRLGFYRRLAQRSPFHAQYLKGWEKRVYQLSNNHH
jgi:lysozyme family protein